MYCPLQQHYSTIFGCDFAPYILGIVHLLFIVVFGLTFIYISFPTTFFFDSFYTSHAVLFCSVSVVVSLLTLSMCFSLQFYVQDTDYNCRSYITYMLRREYVCVDIVYYNVCAQSLSHVWLSVTLWTGAPPGSLVHGISRGRILQWVAISYSRGSSWPRDRTLISHISYIGRWVLYH